MQRYIYKPFNFQTVIPGQPLCTVGQYFLSQSTFSQRHTVYHVSSSLKQTTGNGNATKQDEKNGIFFILNNH